MCECFCSSNGMVKETLITAGLQTSREVKVLTEHSKFRMEITKFAFLTYRFMVLQTCYCYFYYINITITAIINIYLFFLRC